MNISDFDHGKTKLDKINNYLQETFGFSLKKDDVTPEAIQNILYKVRDKQSEIVNESNINDFHKHPDYAKTIMVAEALAIMLKEVSPTQRKTTRKVKESKMTKKVAEHRDPEEHTSELQSHHDLVCRLLLEKKKKKTNKTHHLDKNLQLLLPLQLTTSRRYSKHFQ